MKKRDWIHVAAGAAIGIATTVFIALAWQALYAGHPWPGYESAAAAGAVPHHYNSSPLARSHAMVIFGASGLLVGLLARGVRTVVLSWIGLWGALLVVFALSPAAIHSNLAPLALLRLPAQTLPFLLAGVAAHTAMRLIRAWVQAPGIVVCGGRAYYLPDGPRDPRLARPPVIWVDLIEEMSPGRGGRRVARLGPFRFR